MATFWTSTGVMLFPLGIAVLIQWPNHPTVAFGIMFVGVVLGAIGLSFTIRDGRKANDREAKERERRKQEHLNDQQEHDELIALLAGSKNKMSTPRILRLIERIRDIRGEEDERDDR